MTTKKQFICAVPISQMQVNPIKFAVNASKMCNLQLWRQLRRTGKNGIPYIAFFFKHTEVVFLASHGIDHSF